jgi:uncharacterized protein (TIGR02231 family)
MGTNMRLFVFAISSLIPSLALADIDLASRVDRVVLFPDGAIVTRVAQLQLQAGASTLVLRGLPAAVDPASLRVGGEGVSPFTIGAVDVRTVPGDPAPIVDADLETKLKQLHAERESLQGRIAAAEGKKAVIERYAQASPEKLSNEAKPLEVAQWATAWNAIGEGLAQVNEDLRTLRSRTSDLDAQISALERARPQPVRPGAPKRDVAIAVDAPAPVAGELQVSYRVAGAGWAALYDARLETGEGEVKPSLVLVRRAQVSQRTGEVWDNVRLSVSTVRVNRGTAAPDLPPLQVSFLEPVMREAPARPSSAPVMPDESRDLLRQDRLAASKTARDEQATEQQALVEAGSFQATFHVPGRVTVPENGATKSVVLYERNVTPVLSVRASPVVDETSYLEASFTNDDESPIMPGEVALHRDGAYVGRARLKLVATGETVDLGFGADDRVKVTRVPLGRRESEPSWIGQTRSDVREFKTTVRNLHKRPIRVTVVDRVPFSENAAITVEVLREITPPTERDVQDRRGVMAWSSEYAPMEQKEIRFGYRLKWPAEKEVIFAPKPVGSR